MVIPQRHYPSYAFDLPDEILARLILATKQVAPLLDSAFDDVGRCAIFFEGFGGDHVHSKLFPMHGTANIAEWRPIESRSERVVTRDDGDLSSHDAQRADDERLAALADHIRRYGARLA